jgi:hypothetical protein
MATTVPLKQARTYKGRTVRKLFGRKYFRGAVTEVNESLLDETQRLPPFFRVR